MCMTLGHKRCTVMTANCWVIFPARSWLVAEIKVIIPTSREFVEEEIEDGL